MYETKKNCNIRNIFKMAKEKCNFTPRSNTQEIAHRKNKNTSFGKNKITPKKTKDDFFRKNSAININSIKIEANKKSSINSDSTKSNIKINNSNKTEAYYKQIINNKNKEIRDLERKIEKEKDKLSKIKDNKKIINKSINSLSLSKTKNSTNYTERNVLQVNSICNSQTKINSYPLQNNNGKGNILINSKNKLRAKSYDYKKSNDLSKQNKNFFNYNNSTRVKNKSYINNNNHKKCNNSTTKQKTGSDNIILGNNYKMNMNMNINNKKDGMSVEETRKIFDSIYNRYKELLELLKISCGDNNNEIGEK